MLSLSTRIPESTTTRTQLFVPLKTQQARWSYPDPDTIFALLVVSLLLLCFVTYHLNCQPPKLPWKPLTPPLPSKTLIGYVTATQPLSYSVASCRCKLSMCQHGYLEISSYLLLFKLMHIYIWQQLKAWPCVLFRFCHTSSEYRCYIPYFALLTCSGLLWGPPWPFILD